MARADPGAGGDAPSMSIAERCAFSLLPALALGGVLWLLASFALPLDVRLAWIPALGVGFDLHIDGLAVLMLLMITGVGVAVFTYAGGYLDGHPQQRRLYVLLTMFIRGLTIALLYAGARRCAAGANPCPGDTGHAGHAGHAGIAATTGRTR